jgi:hypothetical protein
MARSLNKKYFGSTNTDGVGGEGVASVAVSGTFGGKTPATYDIPASVISAPQIAGGTKPTLTLTYLTASTATVAVVTAGTGYTSTTTISGAALQALGGAGTGTIVLTATLTATVGDAIVCQGITVGSTNRTSGNDIIRQVSGRRYKIQTQDGTAICALKASAPTAAGEMAIVATDASSGTYYVTKLTKNLAVLTRGTGTVYTDGASVPWTFGTATATICKIPSA